MKNKKIFSILFFILFIGCFTSCSEAKVSNKAPEDYANVVIFAHFSGENAQADKEYFIENRDVLIKLYEGSHGRSVKNYLKTISYGKFNIKNIFPQDDGEKIVSLELPYSQDSAYNGNIDLEIINYAIEKIPSISNKVVDYNNDGLVDNLTIVLKGGSGNLTPSCTFVSHKSNYPGDRKWSNKNIGTYNILNTYSLLEASMPNYSGVIVHEFLHSLNYPDLYRNKATDNPVYIWDIMASANHYMPYPLAYLRMKFTNWIDIDEITENSSLRLDVQSNANGNQAYILKSPLNDYEFFVVEYRKKAPINYNDEDSLDRGIGGSGIIVYRVDTTVTGLSNYFGNTGIYVFRPNGDENEYVRINNAYLSLESGRTSIGNSDINATLKDNALTFSDGSNSGIVIKNVSSASGDSITFDVEIPKKEDYDIWKNTNIPDLIGGDEYTNKLNRITSYDDKLYVVSFNNGKLYTQTFDGASWKTLGTYTTLSDSYIREMKVFENNKELYLMFSNFSCLKIYKWNKSKNVWEYQSQCNDAIGDFDFSVINNEIYFVGISGMMSDVSKLYKYTTEISCLGTYYNNMAGQPKVMLYNDSIYVMARSADNKIKIFLYKNGAFEEKTNTMTSNTYDAEVFEDKIYFVLGRHESENLKVTTFDGQNWKTIDTGLYVNEPELVKSQGNLYLTAIDTSSNTIVYSYNYDNKIFEKEGTNVDAAAQEKELVSIGNTIFVYLYRSIDGSIAVKSKETVNSLLSLSITPPMKTCYKVGDEISLEGLKVIANYTKERKELKPSEYSISNFSTDNEGSFDAIITYCGISNSFNYEVFKEEQLENNDEEEKGKEEQLENNDEEEKGKEEKPENNDDDGTGKDENNDNEGEKGDTSNKNDDKPSVVTPTVPNKMKFNDVKTTDWYYNAVKYTFENNIISGYNANQFAPNDKLTRGMIVTILYRMEGSPNVSGSSKFSDVDSLEWYSKAVKWAADNGIVHGYSGTTKFGPNDNIIRQDLAGILRNYSSYKKKNVSINSDLSKFSDEDKIDSYAISSIKWAVGVGVITGNADGTLNPKGTATRAEAAAMIQKYCNRVGR